MDLESFTPISALVGGMCIGLSAMILLKFAGKICGISGIFGQLITPTLQGGELIWRGAFLLGMILGGWLTSLFFPASFSYVERSSMFSYALAGILVGYGTRLGSGCTSGHGICGISRFSKRSVVATCTFMASGALTVVFLRTFIWK